MSTTLEKSNSFLARIKFRLAVEVIYRFSILDFINCIVQNSLSEGFHVIRLLELYCSFCNY